MDKKKQKALKKAGWKIGTTQDFLDLSKEEMQYIDLRLSLAQALVSKRKALHLSQKSFAQKVHSSQSRVAKMEAGDASVSLDLLIRSLFTVGTTKKQLASFIAGPQKKTLRARPFGI
ncbi:helix-turn-helix transcriptional regulator [Sulfobacillus acidophilus]|uniref:Helix-turn-helix transcriptional regulator n=1 Tax=Sulfobacillus acidophilus TaxID=53633 RepID=A0ABS3AVX3_9FIRM|nr:helix-turn-helix transcriptional regulator [Sulfobacillus acidophilus]